MKLVLYLLFFAVFTVDYLFIELGVVGRSAAWLPEILSIAASALIILRILTKKPVYIRGEYLLVLAFLVVHVIAGIILNSVPSGAVFMGLRTYFKYLPFFLVPAVYEFSEAEMQAQFKTLLVMALLQLPLVIYQRFFQFAGIDSGDPISGTLVISSILSLVLISVIAVLVAFYLNKRIDRITFAVMLALLFLPTTLNETKGTLVFLPVAMIVPVVLFFRRSGNFARAIPPIAVAVVLLLGFVAIYNTQPGRSGEGLGEFLSEGSFEYYLYKGSEAEKAGDAVGKFDSFVLAVKTLSDDWARLAFGLGIGNITDAFSSRLRGEYAEKYAYMDPSRTALAFMIWEIGLIGLLIIMIMCYLVFRDALRLSRESDLGAVFALGWTAVVIIYVGSFVYKNVLTFNVIGYLFWYFSGYIAATRFRKDWAAMSGNGRPSESKGISPEGIRNHR